MIATLLPSVAAVVTADPGDERRALFPGEERLIAASVPSRRAEFAAGRAAGRRAMQQLGVPEQAILADERRAPQWPDGVVGSITHCVGFTAAAVASRRDIAMLGIDAERAGAIDEDEAELLVGPGERRRAEAVLGSDAGRLLFSAKESIYKAWYPRTGRWLDFHDVTVSVESGGLFTVEPAEHLDRADRDVLAALRGQFAIGDDHVFTAVHALAEFHCG